MLDIKLIRENPEVVRAAIRAKHSEDIIDQVLGLDRDRRSIIQDVETLKSRRNSVSEEISKLKRAKENADEKIAEMKGVGDEIAELDGKLREKELRLNLMLDSIPNIPHPSVPIGNDAADNVETKRWSPNGDESAFMKRDGLDHLALAERHKLFDFKRGAKITAAGFPVYMGRGAQLERAFINFMLDLHTRAHGYTEVLPPFFVNAAALRGTGQFPKFADQVYYMPEDQLYAIPTAEVPVTNLYADEVLQVEQLPLLHCAFSACFRREAGSYGKDTRGFLRVHEFNKVELVKFVLPETSYEEHEKLTADAERVLELLGIAYRRVLCCTGDQSFSNTKQYDLEVWAPVEGKWLEASSCSNFEDYQARRANIRFRRDQKAKPEFVHTLNGSGLATSRLMVAFLETFQQNDGTIAIPEVLHPYLPFTTID
ncbi:MAG: serine--tRNA ligase [Bacteroidota bacterium]|nr:serine--tRNA ligase [Bacteroidota bacterium]MDP4232382.1 serine--tRNA ligase [Bacteroidota bacterium]MDP4241519.1 serine--tRNA ligase [Bacteroidota bacterium]MDP4288253.1 serine--tRNA ligase [Bacteroidota bacterium]